MLRKTPVPKPQFTPQPEEALRVRGRFRPRTRKTTRLFAISSQVAHATEATTKESNKTKMLRMKLNKWKSLSPEKKREAKAKNQIHRQWQRAFDAVSLTKKAKRSARRRKQQLAKSARASSAPDEPNVAS